MYHEEKRPDTVNKLLDSIKEWFASMGFDPKDTEGIEKRVKNFVEKGTIPEKDPEDETRTIQVPVGPRHVATYMWTLSTCVPDQPGGKPLCKYFNETVQG